MDKIIKKLQGRKSLIVLGLALVLGIIEGLELYSIPNECWFVITLLFGTTVKLGSNRIEKEIKDLEKILKKRK